MVGCFSSSVLNSWLDRSGSYYIYEFVVFGRRTCGNSIVSGDYLSDGKTGRKARPRGNGDVVTIRCIEGAGSIGKEAVYGEGVQ